DSVTGLANPKSSTGRLDIFTRMIVDQGDAFDMARGGYEGKLYAEISPCSFAIRVRKGTRLNQLRFRRRNSQQLESGQFALPDRALVDVHRQSALIDGPLMLRNGLVLSVDLTGDAGTGLVGYRAQRFAGVIDVDRIAEYDPREFWEPIHVNADRRLILDP